VIEAISSQIWVVLGAAQFEIEDIYAGGDLPARFPLYRPRGFAVDHSRIYSPGTISMARVSGFSGRTCGSTQPIPVGRGDRPLSAVAMCPVDPLGDALVQTVKIDSTALVIWPARRSDRFLIL